MIQSTSQSQPLSSFRVCSYAEYKRANPEAKDKASYFCVDGVYFSASKKGKAIDIHIAAPTRKSKLNLRQAVNAFVDALLKRYNWCRMIIATIRHDRPSVKNLAKKCGFTWIGDTIPDGYSVYARYR